jgi:hypothetical protein
VHQFEECAEKERGAGFGVEVGGMGWGRRIGGGRKCETPSMSFMNHSLCCEMVSVRAYAYSMSWLRRWWVIGWMRRHV